MRRNASVWSCKADVFHAFPVFVFPKNKKKRAHRFALTWMSINVHTKSRLLHELLCWSPGNQPFSSVFAPTESPYMLGHPHIVNFVPQSHLHVQYPSILMWCFLKCFSVMLQWIKHWRLLSSCLRWKHGNMAASAGACEKSWTVCLFRLVCKFIQKRLRGWVCHPLLDSDFLHGCVYWDMAGSWWQWWLGVADVCCLCSRLNASHPIFSQN